MGKTQKAKKKSNVADIFAGVANYEISQGLRKFTTLANLARLLLLGVLLLLLLSSMLFSSELQLGSSCLS